MAKKRSKPGKPKSAVECALAEKKACVKKLEAAVSNLKMLRNHEKAWAKAIVRGKPVQLNERGFFPLFFYDYSDYALTTCANSVWNVLAKADPAACIAFHKAGMAQIVAGIKQADEETKKLSKATC